MEFAEKKADKIEFSPLKTVWFLVICHISFFPLDFNIFHPRQNRQDPELPISPMASPRDALHQTPSSQHPSQREG